jgi:hypothetical protein
MEKSQKLKLLVASLRFQERSPMHVSDLLSTLLKSINPILSMNLFGFSRGICQPSWCNTPK